MTLEPKQAVVGKATFASSVMRSDSKAERDLIKSIGLPMLKPTIRSSGISDEQECPRKFMFGYRLGLKPKKYKSATTVGTHTHRILGSLAENNPWKYAYGVAHDKYQETLEELEALASNVGMLPWGTPLDSVRTAAYKDFGLGAALAWFVWEHDPIDFDKWDVIATEKLIEIKWEGIKTPIRVRTDVLLRNKRTGGIYFIDYKTTSQDPMDRIAMLHYELQPKLYRVAVESMLQYPKDFNINVIPGSKLEGVIHCIVKKPGIRVKQKENIDQYIERAEADLREKMKDPNSVSPYARSMIRYTGPLVDEEFLFQLRAHDLACRAHVSLPMFPRHAKACYNWNTPCEYMPLCQGNVSSWKRTLDARFEVRSRDEDDMYEHA